MKLPIVLAIVVALGIWLSVGAVFAQPHAVLFDVYQPTFVPCVYWMFLLFVLLPQTWARHATTGRPLVGRELVVVGVALVASLLCGTVMNRQLWPTVNDFQVRHWNEKIASALTLERWSARPDGDAAVVSADVVAGVAGDIFFRASERGGDCPSGRVPTSSVRFEKGERKRLEVRVPLCRGVDTPRQYALSFRPLVGRAAADTTLFYEGTDAPHGNGIAFFRPLPLAFCDLVR